MKDNNFDFSKLFNIKKFHSAYLSAIAAKHDIGVGCLVFIKAITINEFHSQQELSEFIGCNKAHTSRIISTMLKKGYIRMPADKNSDSVISLTEEGQIIAKEVEKLEKLYINKLIVNIPKEDLQVFKKVCKQIYENSKSLADQ